MRRFLAMLLCVVMVVGLVPTSVFAAETPLAAAIFASDIHAKTTSVTGDNVSDTGVSTMKSIMSTIGENGITYNTIGFVGDTYTDIAGSEADMASVAQSALGQSAEVRFAYGDHDEESDISPDSGLMYTGDHYYIYHISDANMRSKVASQSEISYTDAITNFKNDAASMDKTKVLFIMSHAPLHDRRDDNTYANDWYTAISEVAATMDVVVFWAHNHTSEDSTDRNAYYVASSYNDGTEEMTIYGGSTVVPNFTYMNAGYIYPNGQSSSSVMRYGVATTVEIYADEMVFQDYNSSGEYTNATYSHNVSVKRAFAASEPAATLTGIAVSGETEYTVGGNGLNLTVTATYSDGTTKDVTEAASFEPAELTASGTYTVTATYSEGEVTKTASVEGVKAYLYGEDDYGMMSVEVFAQGATALTVTWDDAADAILEAKGLFSDYVVYDLALTNYSASAPAEYAMYLVEDMDTTDLALYHVADDGTLTQVPFVIENDCLVFSTTLTGTFAYGAVTVPEGYALDSLAVANAPKNHFVGDRLDLTGEFAVQATYIKEGEEDFVRTLYAYEENNNPDGYILNQDSFNMTVAGTYNVEITYGGKSVTFPIYVWDHDFTASDVTVHVGEGEYGVTAAVVAESTNTNVATAIQYIIEGDNYVAYDITLTYSSGYAANDADKTVTLPIPEGVTNPVVYYVSDSGKSVVDMKAVNNGNGTVTFTTDHFSTYVVGEGTVIETESGDATVEGSSTTTTKTVYVLTSSISSGNDYLIVNGNAAGSYYALANNNGSVAATGVTVKTDSEIGTYIELDDATDELWTTSDNIDSSTSSTLKNGSHYLNVSSNGTLSLNTSTGNYTNWRLNSNMLYRYRRNYTSYYLRYSNGWTTTSSSSSASSIYFYVPTEVTVTTGTPGHTYSVEGTDMEVAAVKDATVDLSSILYDTPTDTNTKTDITVSSGLTPTYEVVTTKGNPAVITSITDGVATLSGTTGTAVVKVTYTSGDLVAWDEFVVTATTPDHYSIQLHLNNDGVLGEEITAPVALKGVKAGDTYSVWAVVKAYATADDTTGTDLGALGDALSWTVSDLSIATIDTTTGVITFTGDNYGTIDVTVAYEGADGKVITDTITISVTDSQYVVPGDGTNDFPEYPNEGAVRFDKTATAVGNYSETGIAMVELSMTGVPYTTGSELDVVIMLDQSTSMDDNRIAATQAATKAFIQSIVVNEDGSFNDNRIYVGYFNGANTYDISDNSNIGGDLATIDSQDELDALFASIDDEFDGSPTTSGTQYAVALEKCYDRLNTAKTDGTGNDRQQFCVFMSDGVPTTYQYSATGMHGSTSSTSQGYTDMNGMFTGTNYDTRSSSYVYEYYSTQMKANGVIIYTVGLGLEAKNNAWSSASATQCLNAASLLLNDIAGPAYETEEQRGTGSDLNKKDSYFYSVEDEDAAANMTNVFEGIAQKIVEAAKDVVVEDKIGSNYTVNFSIPGYGTDNEVSADALDGTTEFYIQAVEYQLDANKERTGDPAILENFTFNSNGTLKSHTVNGTACSSCSHVTTTNGVITKIDGTYFDYEVKADGEYLTWNSEKITTTELALQYFAYLDKSTGVDPKDQIAAGTYYTNEYATLTYTNYNGNQVQQEFPIPQMTWNGAQVSYVFYLVNAAGQPVNKAGRVVPFAEAVYITDVYTHHVLWNDLEQSAGLEAKYLAEELVPDIYALYDDDAGYNIHVYEDEAKVNLNNHFVIKGDVTDDYNTTWTNAKTTYVFNAKSDAIKYNTAGAYIAYDEDKVATTYLCKGDGTTNASFDVAADVTKDNFASGTYYTLDAEGKYVYAPNYTEGVTYYKITSASYTAVEGETQALANSMESTTGGTIIDGYVYYVDEYGKVYTIVQKSNGTEVREGFDFSNTTVAFAVVWKAELTEDVVVVDYGLDVVVNVAENDALASGVVGVRADAPNAEINKGTYDAAKATSADIYIDANADTEGLKELKIGTATVENMAAVRFSLDKTNGTQFNDPAVFYYESDVNYYDSNNELKSTSMYSSVTVIPATTVYYEDSFVTYTNSSNADETYGTWAQEGTTLNKTQATDRPGENKLNAAYDADNVYGYDAAYSTSSTYSMGSAMKVKVKSGVSGMASFVFYGTGFDVMSMTDSTTGMILVQVFNESNEKVKDYAVNTYYGYAYGLHEATYTYTCVQEATETTEAVYSWLKTGAVAVTTAGTDGEPAAEPKEGDTYVAYETGWYLAPSDNAVYQVPVIKINRLPYGKYTVKVIASYNTVSDVTGAGSYNFYLDGIRIYDPTGVVAGEDVHDTNGVVSDAYIADGEAWPEYAELRNNIITANDFNALTEGQQTSGLIFIDNTADTDYNVEYEIADYISYGPNNELYLANNQAIAFNVADAAAAKDVQLGIKLANGSSVTYEINGDSYTVTSATEMYYSILEYAQDGVVVIENVGGGILSLTNIKVTYAPAADAEATSLMWMDDASAEVALMSLRRAPVVEEEIPEVTEPEATEPEEIIPEETVPEATEPEATEPEATEPEEIIPEETAPEATEPEATEPETSIVETITNAITNVINKITNALSNLFSRWFR